MATSPILLYDPVGGVPPGTPGTTPPVYSQADVTPLVEGQAYVDVVFGTIQTNDEWVLVACEVENTTDFEPLNIWRGIITDRTQAGFRLQLNGLPDSENYYLRWAVSGVNIAPTPATTYILSGATSGLVGVQIMFTVDLPASTTGTATITPSDNGGGGTFSPDSVTLRTGAPSTFTYTPGSAGSKTISVTNTGGLLNPADIIVSVALPATGYSLSGPATGVPGAASTPFTVTLTPAGYPVPAPVIITPSDGGGGGTFAPTTVTLTTAAPSATFTYTAGSVGVKTISATNDGGLTNPSNLTFTAAVFDPSSITGLKGWYKADALALSDGAAVSSWTDSSGSGNTVTQATGANQPIYKSAIVNGKPVVRFDGVNDYLATGVGLTYATDYTAFVVFKTTGLCAVIGVTSVNRQLFTISATDTIALYDGVSSVGSSTLVTPRSSWNIGCISRSSGTASFFEAGIARGTAATSASIVIDCIGMVISAGWVNGDLAEILIYDSALSTTDRQNVEGYLKTKYGIP